ncbi:MAG: SnoaL-like polyketide cyclase [Hyphomicrobiales bacterium]|nr:SnoaL-like polyketide cyclase [Hyphomicrobiales bacterium]
MARRARMISLLDELVAARSRRDFAELDRLMCDDVTYQLSGQRRLLPYAGIFEGKAAVRQALDALHVEFVFSDLCVEDVIVDRDAMAVRWSARWTDRGTGESALLPAFAHLTFAGERLQGCADFVDTAAAAKLAGWPS